MVPFFEQRNPGDTGKRKTASGMLSCGEVPQGVGHLSLELEREVWLEIGLMNQR